MAHKMEFTFLVDKMLSALPISADALFIGKHRHFEKNKANFILNVFYQMLSKVLPTAK